MTSPALIDVNGQPIPLERQLASGGEGAVFTLRNNPNRVAKVYHRPPTAQTVEKLTLMIRLANPALLEWAAWPTKLLYHARTRQLAGFEMPRLTDCQPIQHLYNPVQRLKCYPRAGWDFQVRTARNLAAAFDEVHKAGGLVGDVNQSNVQVSTQALVRLIDCDSFQIRANGKAYLCEVGVAHYIPPELQGKSLRGVVRTENHDRFGLAVLIYQLLFVGRHPYAGVYRGSGDPSFEQLIAEFRFAQGPAAHTWGMSPPPHTPTFADIPPELGNLFRRAFERGSEAGTRPRPTEWLAALQRLEQSIAECAADPGHKYWRGVQSCVWCRLADHGGPEYYFGVAGGVGTFAVDEAKLEDVLRRLAAVQHIEFPCNRAQFQPVTPPQPRPVSPRIWQLWNIATEKNQQLVQVKQEQANEESKEEAAANLRLQQLRQRLRQLLAEQQSVLDNELREALEAAATDRKERRTITGLLLGATLFGLVIALCGCLHWSFGIAGGLVALIFSTWLGIHYYLARRTPAEQHIANIRKKKRQADAEARHRLRAAIDQGNRDREGAHRARREILLKVQSEAHAAAKAYESEYNKELDARRQAVNSAERSVALLEKEWSRLISSYREDRGRIGAAIGRLVLDCRSLTSEYQAEWQRLTANAEALARLRHMRLHLITDAEISTIGPVRKQILASYNIFTAADIDEQKIRGIKGFGDVLTGNLLAWKEEVLRQFRFNPSTALSPAEQRPVTVKFRTRQQQLITQLDLELRKLESLAPACRMELEKLFPKLQQAVAWYEQARADLQLLNGKR